MKTSDATLFIAIDAFVNQFFIGVNPEMPESAT